MLHHLCVATMLLFSFTEENAIWRVHQHGVRKSFIGAVETLPDDDHAYIGRVPSTRLLQLSDCVRDCVELIFHVVGPGAAA